METSDPRARLMALVDTQGVSLAGLSALLGRNASYLQQFVRKGSPRKLEENDRRTLARFFGVDEAELGGSAGDPAAASYTGQRRAGAEWVDVPRLGLGASAGPGALEASEVAVGQLRFSAQWLKRHGLVPPPSARSKSRAIRWNRPCAMATKYSSTELHDRSAPESTWSASMTCFWSSGSNGWGPSGFG